MQAESVGRILNYSVARAFVLLEFLARADSPSELSTICNSLRLNKSTAYRFLTTLESLGYVDQDPETNRYHLGARVTWLASRFLETMDLRAVARPLLINLRDETSETIHLAVLDDSEVVYIDKVDSKSSMRTSSSVGKRVPAHSTALGKALMAFLPEDAWMSYVEKVGLFRCTPSTITEPIAFLQELKHIREREYSIDNAENEEGIRCVALPVHDHTGKVVAAIGITGWTMTMRPERDMELVALGHRYASLLSSRIGYLQQPTPLPQAAQEWKSPDTSVE